MNPLHLETEEDEKKVELYLTRNQNLVDFIIQYESALNIYELSQTLQKLLK